jgi:hypothetical protein
MEKEIPIVGTIASGGGVWSVCFKHGKQGERSTLSGYGPFPFDRFDIPVIDLTDLDFEKLHNFLSLQFKLIDKDQDSPEKKLQIARELNLKIIEPKNNRGDL